MNRRVEDVGEISQSIDFYGKNKSGTESITLVKMMFISYDCIIFYKSQVNLNCSYNLLFKTIFGTRMKYSTRWY
jgi:hypothetical protein